MVLHDTNQKSIPNPVDACIISHIWFQMSFTGRK